MQQQSSWLQLRRFVYNALHNEEDGNSSLSRIVDLFLIALIIGNATAVLVESIEPIYLAYKRPFDLFEYISIAIFTLEYLLRFWSIAEKVPEQSAWKTRLHWITSGGAVIDLLAILPSYLGYFINLDLRFLRVFRLLRLLKLTRYFISLQILLNVIEREKGSFQAVLFILIIMIILAAGGIYVVENKAQPHEFGSIPQAMWWAVVTLTTVGYGDVVPVTSAGKLLGALITILGVGLAALPAGILATGLANELNARNQKLEQLFRESLLRNEVDLEKDSDTIESIRKEVGLNKELAHQVIVQMIREKSIEEQEKKYNYCPHCGEKLFE